MCRTIHSAGHGDPFVLCAAFGTVSCSNCPNAYLTKSKVLQILFAVARAARTAGLAARLGIHYRGVQSEPGAVDGGSIIYIYMTYIYIYIYTCMIN